jgi:FkbM family methyltransferase
LDGCSPLKLPDGTIVKIAGDLRDLTVMQPLAASKGIWEPHVRAVMEELVRPDWTCMDIGANIGVHTLVLASLSRHVIAFEASPRLFGYLRRNVECQPGIEVLNLALWNENGIVELAGSPEFSGGTFVASKRPHLEGKQDVVPIGRKRVHFTYQVEKARAMRLDDWLGERALERLDFIKIDVEGAEDRVLAGATATLARFRPFLLTEYGLSAISWFDDAPDAYYRTLQSLYRTISIIEPDGSRRPVSDWSSLQARVLEGKGWEDLLCIP